MDIIQRAVGAQAVAAHLHISLDALRKWRELGRVPPKHWRAMADLAKVRLETVAAANLKLKPPARQKRRADNDRRAA